MRRKLVVLKVGLLAMSVVFPSLASGQGLPDVGGHPFRPTWGLGTTLRAEGGDGRVFAVEAVTGDSVTLRHISPSQMNNCYGGAGKIIATMTGVIAQPNLLVQGPSAAAPCVGFEKRSAGDFQRAFEPESNGARHIAITAWTNSNRTMVQGVIQYESDTQLKGVCGGAVIGLVDAAGQLLHYYTPPTGCVRGRIAGGAERRFVTWEDRILENLRGRVAGVKVRSIFTEGRSIGEGILEPLGSAADIIGTLAAAASFLGL